MYTQMIIVWNFVEFTKGYDVYHYLLIDWALAEYIRKPLTVSSAYLVLKLSMWRLLKGRA